MKLYCVLSTTYYLLSNMRLKVNPNRMELLRLRRRYALALRGHRMLKDKLDGLVKEFIPLARRYQDARVSVDRELPQLLRPFVLARMTSPRGAVETALEGTHCNVPIQTTHWRILNVVLTHFEAKPPQLPTFSPLDTTVELDTATSALQDYLSKVLTLAELEHAIRLLTREIGETRRRVNALEYVLLPELRETIKFIKAKLDEAERSHISRLMKIKEQVGAGLKPTPTGSGSSE
jgi:V/A-type H+-transporting ATPase subunit D